jgi:hypothetical protein
MPVSVFTLTVLGCFLSGSFEIEESQNDISVKLKRNCYFGFLSQDIVVMPCVNFGYSV